MNQFSKEISFVISQRSTLAVSASKGLLISVAAVASIASALLLAILAAWFFKIDLTTLTSESELGLDTLWAASVWAVSLAAGGFITSGDERNYVEFQFAPTLVSLIIAVFVYRAARVQAVSISRATVGILSSISIGFGFSLGVAVMGWMARGFQAVQPPAIGSLWVIFTLATLVSLLGSLKALEGTTFISTALWIVKTSASYFVITSIVAAILILVAATYILIEPNFAMSQPAAEEIDLSRSQIFELVLVLIGLVLFAPTLWFTAVTAFAGASYGVSVTSDIALVISDFTNTNLDENVSVSLLMWIGFWAIPISVIILIVPAMFSGTRAVKRHSIRISSAWSFLGITLFLSAVMISFQRLSGLSVRSKTVTELAVEESLDLSVGINLAAIIPWVVLGSIGAYVANRYLSEFIAGSFPRITVGRKSRRTDLQRTFAMKLTGRTLSTVVIGAIVVSLTIVTTERVIALVDSPESRAKVFLTKLNADSIEDFKREYVINDTGAKWFESQILQAGLSALGNEPSYSTNNLNGRKWSAGNLDPVTTVTWESNAKKASAKISYTYDFRRDFLIDRVVFSPKVEQSIVKLSFESKLLRIIPEDARQLSVNGSKVSVGKYMMLPGTYQVEFPGYRLVAPFSEVVSSSAALTNQIVVIPSNIEFPGDSKKLITNQALALVNKCKTANGWNAECLGVTTARAGGTGAQPNGQPPSRFYDYRDTGLSVDSVRCNTVDFDLVAADRINAKANCNAEVSFSREYFDSATVRRCSISLFGFCFQYRNFTVRGDTLSAISYKNNLTSRFTLNAVLRGNELVVEPQTN
jgi:hypothetical protein